MSFAKIPKIQKIKEAKRSMWIEKLLEARIIAIEKGAEDKRLEYIINLFTYYEGAEPEKAQKEKEEIYDFIDETYKRIQNGDLQIRSWEMKKRNLTLEKMVFSYLNKYFNFSSVMKDFEIEEED